MSRQDRIGQGFEAYVSEPQAPNGRAVIVLQEIFGVTPPVKGVADRYAAAGYLALAPDLFWRTEPGLSLDYSKEGMKRAFEILAGFDDTLAMADIEATARHARSQPGIESVAVVGMCLGGRLAWLCAAEASVEAAVAFYGVGIETALDRTPRASCPLLMYFGEKDKYVPAQAREQIAATVRGHREVSMRVLPDADHGFYTRGDPALVAAVHAETLAFLDSAMGDRAASRSKGNAA